jgi:uncharacterized protein DUF669
MPRVSLSTTPIVSGIYLFHVNDAEMRPPKNGGQDYLAVTLEFVDGQYAGRYVWDNLAILHPNGAAFVEKLAELASAVGVLPDEKGTIDTDQLIGQRCRAEIVVEKKPGERPSVNVVRYLGNGAGDAVHPAPRPTNGSDDVLKLPGKPGLNDDIPF